MRIIRQNGVYRDGFTTQGDSGAVNADSTPTVAVYRNGTVDGAVSVTITNLATGAYKYSFTVPSGYTTDDVVQPLITAVIGGDTFNAFGDAVTIGAEVSIKDGAITDAKFTVPTVSGVASGILSMVVQVWRRFFKVAISDRGNGTIKTYADNGSTVITTQTVTKSGDTTTVGAAS